MKLASAWLAQNNLDAGRVALEEASRLEPNNPDIHFEIARLRQAQNDLQASLSAYRRVTALIARSY
uniref:Uncharacterized protein n=1 Tax=Desertifilum tharense IPPAS B-1220 TaxID=1781255 RepID=A0ACD5GVD7_9CYAN